MLFLREGNDRQHNHLEKRLCNENATEGRINSSLMKGVNFLLFLYTFILEKLIQEEDFFVPGINLVRLKKALKKNPKLIPYLKKNLEIRSFLVSAVISNVQ